jgi:branched-chain amino acid transport system permease protein
VPGVILGGFLLVGFQELLRALAVPVQTKLFGQVYVDAEVLRQLLVGMAMVAVMLYRPTGLWPAPRKEDRPQRVRAGGLAWSGA